MVSEFLLLFGHLNLLLLSKEKQKEVKEKAGLTITEAVELFKYGKIKGDIGMVLNFINRW